MADSAHVQTDKKIEEMERHLMKVYALKAKAIKSDLISFSKKVNKRIDELADVYFKATDFEEKQRAKKEYQQYVEEVTRSKEFKRLADRISHDLYLTNVEATEYINARMPEVYTESFNYIGDSLAKDIPEYSFTPATEKEVAEYSDMQLQEVDRRKDESYNKRNVAQSVIAVSLLVVGAKKLFADSVANISLHNYSTYKRHASDMSTYAENKGRLDGMHRASDFGFVTKKKWNSIKDNRTRDSHRDLDGTEKDLDESFLDGEELQEPRDPNAPLAEICNCRCFLTYTLGEYSEPTGSTVAREGTVTGSYKKSSSFKGTKTVNVPEMNYKEWVKWHNGSRV